MDGQQSSEVVQAALEPAVAAPGGPAAPAGVPGLVSALGNHAVAAEETGSAGGVPGLPLDPPTPGDLALGRSLADAVQQRSSPAVARMGGAIADPEPAVSGSIDNRVGDNLKQMIAEHAANWRRKLTTTVEVLEPLAETLATQVIPGISAALSSARAQADPAVIHANIFALADAIRPRTILPSAEPHRQSVHRSLGTAVATLSAMKEPVETTIDNTKSQAASAIASIDSAIAAGKLSDPDPAGTGPPVPRATPAEVDRLQSVKKQLETIGSSLTAESDLASIGALASFTKASEGALRALGGSAHASLGLALATAAQHTRNAGNLLEALGRDAAGNYAAAADSLATALGSAGTMLVLVHDSLAETRHKLSELPEPPAE